MAESQRAARRRRRAARHEGLHRKPACLAAEDVRGGLRRHHVARGVRRPRAHLPGPADLQRRDDPRPRAGTDQRHRPGHGRPGRDRARNRRAEAAIPAAAPVSRGDLVPGLQRAERGQRPFRPADARRGRRRSLRRQRAEGVDDAGPRREVVHAPRPRKERGEPA